MIAAIIVEITQIDERVSEAKLVADFAANQQGFLEVGERVFVFPKRNLNLGYAIDAQRCAALVINSAPDGQRVLVVAQRLIGLVQSSVSNADEVQAGRGLFLIIDLNRKRVSFV